MEHLGNVTLQGNDISLEDLEINELNEHLKTIREKKNMQKENLNEFLNQIYS